MEATCNHPVAEVTVFSKQRARRRRRTRWPWATSTAWHGRWGERLWRRARCVVLVPSHSANLVVELLGRPRRAAVHEHEFQPFVSTRGDQVVEYLFDGAGSTGRPLGHLNRPRLDSAGRGPWALAK
jgi:hypothetical protein